jgi:hypothetical protein
MAMRNWLYVMPIALTLTAASGPAMAKGCIKGAIVGGVAGHYTNHHGVLGAAAGCIIGRHYAKKRARETQAAHGTRPRQF